MRSAAFTSACALTLMLVAAGGASAAEPSASAATSTGASTAPATIPHTVLAGESCRSISKQFWNNDPKAIDKFHAVNPQLLGPVHHLVPGQIVTVLAPPPDARLTFLKPDVFKRVKKQPDWLSAARGDDLFRLDEVNTAKGAGAEVTFRDDSSVQLDENALIVIYGDQAPAPKQQKSGALELVQGDASVNLSALRGEKPLQVKTPAAMVA
ncbi:MAG: FecR domain-containing protein, partial [Deltaproteobacteria bacterium]|nr:FecR domain-containing protein [Deltaproteobacteria bacterium]